MSSSTRVYRWCVTSAPTCTLLLSLCICVGCSDTLTDEDHDDKENVRIEGTVVSEDDQTPIEGAVVGTSIDGQTATTDAAGRFFLETEATGDFGSTEYTITVTAAGFETLNESNLWGQNPTGLEFFLVPVDGSCTSDCGSWSSSVPLPTPRDRVGVVAVNDRIYVMGGADASEGSLPTLEIFDPATGSWTIGTPMPSERNEFAVGVVDGKIYAIGGLCCPSGDFSANQMYDPATDQWTAKAPMPGDGRHGVTGGAIDGKIYVVGGQTGSNSFTNLDIYDPKTDTWSSGAPMPTPRTDVGVAVVVGNLYAIGGNDPAGGGNLRTVEMYDPVSDVWVARSPMKTFEGSTVAVAVIDGLIYATADGGQPARLEVYDPATDSWSPKADMPTARRSAGAAAVGGLFYVVGGRTSGNSVLATMELFTP